MIVSVHLPKTAGTSFGRSLEDHFGDRLYRDYGDAPLNTPPVARKVRAILGSLGAGFVSSGIACVHGHFLPIKYWLLRARRSVHFITWMRDPVERLASHYHFWKRSFDPRTAHAVHRRVVEEDWSFERFYRSPEMRDVYAQFLWGFGLANFSFIGITEHYEDDFPSFARTFLGTASAPYRVETNAMREEPLYVTDARLRAEIERFHQADMQLYRQALELRQRRGARPRAEAPEATRIDPRG